MSHIKSPSSLRHVLSSILSQILCEAFSHSSLLPCLTASVASFSPLPHTLKAPGENRPSLSSGTLSTHGLNFQLLTVTFFLLRGKKKILELLIPHSCHVTRVELASALRGPRGTTCLRTSDFLSRGPSSWASPQDFGGSGPGSSMAAIFVLSDPPRSLSEPMLLPSL